MELLPILMSMVIVGVFPLLVGYLVLLERKVLADFQQRLGPMRVGPHGLLQPLADAVKMLIKEDLVPARADAFLFVAAPILSFVTALGAFAVLPFSHLLRIADVNVGLLVILAFSSIGVLGVFLGGWSSNSHYSLLGAMRASAQLVSYEIAMSLALIAAVINAGSLSMAAIVQRQQELGLWFLFENYGFGFLAFFVFSIAAIAESNRAPFDLIEAESELTGGFHTEYSGFRWGIFMLAEYCNMFILCAVAVTLFLGGYLRPFPSVAWLELPLQSLFPFLVFAASGLACFRLAPRQVFAWQKLFLRGLGLALALSGLLFFVPFVQPHLGGIFWLLFKIILLLYVLIWIRATWPRYRFDQLMDLGWKRLIPLGFFTLLGNAILGLL
jgi:NADH-quinone oxidoreductase subunit H